MLVHIDIILILFKDTNHRKLLLLIFMIIFDLTLIIEDGSNNFKNFFLFWIKISFSSIYSLFSLFKNPARMSLPKKKYIQK